jgi:hypothetical protein
MTKDCKLATAYYSPAPDPGNAGVGNGNQVKCTARNLHP